MSPTAVAAPIGAIACCFLESVCPQFVMGFSCSRDGTGAANVPSEAAMPIAAAATARRKPAGCLVLLITDLQDLLAGPTPYCASVTGSIQSTFLPSSAS